MHLNNSLTNDNGLNIIRNIFLLKVTAPEKRKKIYSHFIQGMEKTYTHFYTCHLYQDLPYFVIAHIIIASHITRTSETY